MPSCSISASLRLARSGSSRSSRKRSRNSSRVSTNRNASSLSPSPASRGLPPPPASGRGRMSPSRNFLLPGRTRSRMPPPPRWKRGSSIPSSGMLTSPPCSTSRMARPSEASFTARCTSALARRRNRCRFSRLLLPGFKRRSTMCMASFTRTESVAASWPGLSRPSTSYFAEMAKRKTWMRGSSPRMTEQDFDAVRPESTLPGLLHPHVPFDQAADLALGIAARHHALEELSVLLLGLAVLLGPERDDRQQILDLREHALLDHLADLLVAAPGRVLAAVMRA